MKQPKSKTPTASPSKAAAKKAPTTQRTEARVQPPSPPTKSKKAVPTPVRKAKATKPGKGSKTDKILALLQRPGGAPLSTLMKATGWQAHSLRAFMSATLGKRRGLTVVSVADENGGERRYSIKA